MQIKTIVVQSPKYKKKNSNKKKNNFKPNQIHKIIWRFSNKKTNNNKKKMIKHQLLQNNDNFNSDPNRMITNLTSDGIRQLFIQGPNQQFILQIIKICQDCQENKICHLADGYCYVVCQLNGEAKIKVGSLEVYDVIRIHREDFIILGLERTPSLQLCNLNVLGMRLLCTIGQPVAYASYFHNQFVNPRGSTKISEGQKIQNTLTLPQLLNNYPHVPNKWILKARVQKKPDNINYEKPFMVITLVDEKQNNIQAIFFGQSALNAYTRLVNNRLYLFSNGQIKTKKNSDTEFQIKFTQQSQIIPIETMKSVNSVLDMDIENNRELTIQNIIKNQFDGKPVNLLAKIYKIKLLNQGRCLNVIDQNNDIIEIILWEEIKDQASQGITYLFENLRTKQYRNILSLQSMRSKTQVSRSCTQLQKQNTQHLPKNQYCFTTSKNLQLRQLSSLMNVSQILGINVTQKQFKNVNGFLIINTVYMDLKHFFKVQCPACHQNDISHKPILCRKCNHTEPNIRWNLRCHIIDTKQQIKCIMNEELCRNIFKMSSIEGFKKLNEDVQGFKKKINEISHVEGIFKLKMNPYGNMVYYNILEMYKYDSSILLKKTYQQFKNLMDKSKQQ